MKMLTARGLLVIRHRARRRCTATMHAWRPLSGDQVPRILAWLEERRTFPAGWRIDGDTMSKDGEVDDLVSRETFGDFEIEFEWKLTPGGNAGFFYRGTREYDHIYWSAPEYQLLDDALHPDGRNRLTSAAAAYALYAAPAGIVKAVRRVERGAHRRRRGPRRALAERPESRELRVVEPGLEGESRGQQVCAVSELRAREVRAASVSRATMPERSRCATCGSGNCADQRAVPAFTRSRYLSRSSVWRERIVTALPAIQTCSATVVTSSGSPLHSTRSAAWPCSMRP